MMVCQISVLYWQDHLRKYGYLSASNNDDITKEQFELAVRAFQQFAGLPVTGK